MGSFTNQDCEFNQPKLGFNPEKNELKQQKTGTSQSRIWRNPKYP
jgi:hypothetical protein